jgi:phosphatidylserine decarboxylase
VEVSIARGGRAFVALSTMGAVVTLPFLLYACAAFLGLALFLVFVFRDPNRRVGDGIVAAADGTVREIDRERGMVSTYLALRNVHVTRAPLAGKVEKTVRSPGKHSPAFSKNTARNERVEISVKTAIGEIRIIQTAGALARRIVPYVVEGQEITKAERMSLIRFGSRVDVYLPPASVKIVVEAGQKLNAGTTCIAEVLDGKME